MGWNNIWGYVLVFLFLNSIIYSYADLNNNEDNKILFTSLDKVNSVLSKNNIYINEKDVPFL